jgi:murein DD-endopeptidase MepM/ murein hydrolase activator NlpD
VPAHAARRSPAAPALLLTVAAAALGGLALLPARTAATPTVLAANPSVTVDSESERAAILGRPPVRRTTVIKAAKPAKPASPRPVKPRATRQRIVQLEVKGYVCPVRGPHHFTDDFGDPRPGGRRHQGNDILSPYGTPVVAVFSGVIKTNYSTNGGISLYLEGTDGNEYFYAHNSRNVAVTGQRVSTGEVIGYVGNTGDARGGPTHVHFERHPGGGHAVDPYPFLIRVC